MVAVVVQTIGLTLASAVAGVLLCMVLWLTFRLAGHPAWGPPLVLVPVALVMAGALPDSEFLHRTLIFAAAAVGPFCITGLIWRAKRREQRHHDGATAPAVPSPAPLPERQYYPAIVACIREDRRPSPGELKTVTRRIWREVYAHRHPRPGFAERRSALRTARASLEGS